MRTAKSAKARIVLGASLAAMVVPGISLAEQVSGSLMAIDSSSAFSIDSSSARAIDSSSALAIDSSSGLAIDSSSALAIDSSSGLAIDSSSGLAIDSSSGLAIDSSSALAIDSSSGLAIDSSSGLAIDSSSGLAIDSSSLLLAGPIDSLDSENGTFMSLGQTVSAPRGQFNGLRVGDYVMVSGRISGAGAIDGETVTHMGQRYIPGASEVYLTGMPTNVDARFGTAMIGELQIDYTPSMGGSDFEGIGAAITVIGIQPTLGGMMIGDRVLDQTELFLRN